MAFLTAAGIQYYQFERLGDGLKQAVFTRRGGSSPEPWASLNMGGSVGDDPVRVRQNRNRALLAMNCTPESVFDVWQVHGTDVAIAEAPRADQSRYIQADAILSNKPGITLLMRFADCVPIFLHDPVHKVIGIVHAGWMGTVHRMAQVAVETMQARFDSAPSEILAGIGPSIGPDHYEVGPDVIAQVRRSFGQQASSLLVDHAGAAHFDLWLANQLILEEAGIQQIEVAGLCTACNISDWYSHRAEKGHTGRFGAIIALNP